MAQNEIEIGDTEMVYYSLNPNGPVHGPPTWAVVSGNGTMLSDPSHADWDAALPEGHQMFLVSDTLPDGEPGPLDTLYEVTADVDLGPGVAPLTDTILLHVINKTTMLNLTAGTPVPKP